jgi:hypothetical protein
MQTVKLSLAPKSAAALNVRYSGKDDGLINPFPKPQYFQVHFEHLHENTRQLQAELTPLKDTMAHFDEKLGRLLALLVDKAQ